jgi:hypothetical protein
MRRIVGPGGGGQSLELPQASSQGGSPDAKLGDKLSENTTSCKNVIVSQRTNANEAVRIVSLIRAGFVLSEPATERQRSTCRRTPALSYSEWAKPADPIRATNFAARTPKKRASKNSYFGKSKPSVKAELQTGHKCSTEWDI